MLKPRYSIGSNLRDERFELEISVQGRVLSRAIATFYLVENVPSVVIDGVCLPWEEMRQRADDFFSEWAPNWSEGDDNAKGDVD